MKQKWTSKELEEQYTILPEEHILLKDIRFKTSPAFATLLTFYRNEKRFPKTMTEIPKVVVEYICNQLEHKDIDNLINEYDLEGRTASLHRNQIRQYFGFREAIVDDENLFDKWLINEQLNKEQSLEHLIESGKQWFNSKKIEIPASANYERLIRSAIKSWEFRLFEDINKNISSECILELDKILASQEEDTEDKKKKSVFSFIKDDPGKVGLESIVNEFEKFDILSNVKLKEDIIKDLSSSVLKKYRQRISIETVTDLKSHPEKTKYALLAIYCFIRKKEIIDTIADLLISLVHKISKGSERKVDKEMVAEIKQKVSGKNKILFKMSESSLKNPTGSIKDVIFPVANEETLQALVDEFKDQGVTYQEKVHSVIKSSFKNHYRKMIPMIFKRLEFKSNNGIHQPIIDAIKLLKTHIDESNRYFTIDEENKIDEILKKNMRAVIVETAPDGKERINRISFEICLLQALRDGLRCREIWVEGSNKYRNPDEDLPADFEIFRTEYYTKLKLPQDGKNFIASIKREMEEELRNLNKSTPKNKKVKILEKKDGWICLTPLEAQDEPKNLKAIKGEIFNRWEQTSLLDVLKETDLRIGITDKFASVATKQYLEKEILQRRLLSCLFALGTNTGLSRVSSVIPGEQHHELVHVKKTYITKDYLRNAIASVANATLQARMKKIWGEATVSCASDSKKFGAWTHNLMVEHHIRYGGRGVMIYWHVEKNSICIYSQLKTCSSSEVSAMIEGVLRHCTEMEVEKHFTDSHGQSEVAFAFTHLLGFQLMPRLKRIHAQKLYLPNNEIKNDLKNLTPILTRAIDWEYVEQQYDEMVKHATALRQGTAETESILKKFTRNGIKHPTYLALAELGKAIKTIFLCKYLQSEELRQEIHEGLNVIERWNGVNGFVFYGKNSEFTSNRLEEQELSVLALHLLQSSIVYINTLMIQEVLSEDYWFKLMQEDDFRALTPLIHSHINPYGRFSLDMEARIPFKELIAA